MDGLITFFLDIVKEAPGYFALTIGFIAVIFALYIKVRSISIEEVTSIGKLQSAQVGQLLQQVSQLSKDLAAARKEISHLYDKIDELEGVVRTYRNRLRDAEIDLGDDES
jgi:chromosome segregation ATPase